VLIETLASFEMTLSFGITNPALTPKGQSG